MIDLNDIRQDIFDIKTVPKVLYVYRGDTFELDLDLAISSSELNSVVLNCDGLPEAILLTLLETTDASSKWHLLLNKSQTLILAPRNHNFTITIVRTDGTELTLYKGIMTVNNRVHSNYSNNYYIAALLKQTVPTTSDNDYLIGTMWVNVLTDRVYFLTSVVNNEAKWTEYSDPIDKLNIRIDDILDGATIVKKAEQDANGNNIVNIYETKIDSTSKKSEIDGRLDTAESEITKIKDGTTVAKKAERDANNNVIATHYETKADVTSKLLTKVDKTQKIIGIDLQDDILLTEFKTALGNATQSVAGLLSAEDKTHLDGLVALLENDDSNVVDTIGEILEIFQNYPEGANLVTALNGKVDKEAGKGLSQNDYTDIDKNRVSLSYTHSEIVDGSNPHNTKFVNIADKPTTRDGYGITDVYTKPETYTQLEIDNLFDNLSAVKGLKSTLLTLTELSNGDTISTNLLTNNGAFVVFTATDTLTGEIDSDTVPVSTIITGKKFVFFDNQEVVFTIGETNSTFETSEDITLKINLLYLDSENSQAVDVDFDGSLTNYLENQENVQSAISKLDEELKTTNDNSSNHITDINNPHGVTKAQVGLSNVDNTSDANKPISTAQQTALDNKVDKVEGKGLSTNDYTTTEKNKLAGIASGAEANVQSDWNATSGDALILNKPVIPSKVSDLTNDTGYITGYTETDPIFTAWDKSTGISITKSQVSDFAHTHVKADITDFAHNHDDRYYTEEETNTLLNAKLSTSLKGVVNGLAELGSDGKVLSGQLPSYVDDVLEYANLTAFPANGESGKIYIASDTNKTYRWSGSGYTEISASLAIGETSSTAGRGDWTKTAHDHTFLTNNPHSVTKAQVELSNVDNTSDLDKPISTAQQTALDNKVDKNNLITAGTKAKITYDSKGLVTAGADLTEADIPTLSASKITQDANNRFVTDAEKTTWNGKQSALTAGDGISISGNIISADSGLDVEEWDTATKTLALSDANKLFVCLSTGNKTVTVPTNTNVPFPIGTMITFSLTSSDKVTFSGQSGVDIASIDGLVELKTQHGMASLIKIGGNYWQLVGALE